MFLIPRKTRGVAMLAAGSLLGAVVALVPAGAALAGTVGISSPTSTGTLGPAAPGDAITQQQVLSRAQDWINDAVPYSEGEAWEDSAVGGPYRTDCSGFISMAWGLSANQNTETLPSVSTVTDGNISGDTNLQPGDALDYYTTHVVLFNSWVSQSAGTFYYDAEHEPGVLPNVTEGSIYASTLEGYSISDFEALRYNNIASTAPVSLDAAGDHVAFVEGNGNVANDWVSSGAWDGPSAIGGQARSDSPVVFDANADHAFFIDADGYVSNDWVSGGAWSGPSRIGGQARAGSPIVTNAAGTLVAFIDTSGNVVNDWVSDGAWEGPSALGGTARSDSSLAFDSAGDRIYFVDSSGYVTNDWVSSGAWSGPSRIGGQARAGSSISTDAAGSLVAFVDTNGNLANDWVSGGTWDGPSALGGASR